MRIRDLGPLLVEGDGRTQPVVGSRGAAMLALLVVHANHQVSVDALTEAAWGERVTAGAASTLLSHIWRLRQILEPDRRRGQAPQVLLNDGGGYRLVGTGATIDSLSFAAASAEVRDLLADDRPQEALQGADTALGLWRGRPYGVSAEAHWAQPAIARLDELHVQLQERRIVALVALGAFDTALSDLQPMIAALPYHETLRALQMETLHRSRRTEQALEVFQATRRTLVEEVGIEPGRDLQDLHRRILEDDVSLAGLRPTPSPAPTAPQTPGVEHSLRQRVEIHLPPTLTPLVGRESEVGQLRELVGRNRLLTVSGPAGCGKTRLAVEVARAASGSFPDGVWFVDLAGVDDPDLVVDVVISTIGFVLSAGPSPLDGLKAYLGTRRVLLLLDNCEHLLSPVGTIAQAVLGDPDEATGCHILTTSRERLGLPAEVSWSLVPLGLPGADGDATEAPALQLLLQRLRAANPSLELDERALADAARICRALDGLPLPLELAAARVPAFSLAEIAEQVRTDPGRLRRPGRTGHDRSTTLRSTIDRSYRLLSPPEQQAHRCLAVVPGPFTLAVAAELLEGAPEAEDVLVELVNRSMVATQGAPGPGRPTAFRQLATVRSHAQHALTEVGGTEDACDRRDSFSARLLGERPALGSAREPEWYDRVDDDYATVRATLTRQLLERPSCEGGLLAVRLPYYWYYRGRLAEATRWLQLGHETLLGSAAADLAQVRTWLAAVLTLQGRWDEARPLAEAATALLPDPADPRAVGLAEAFVGLTGAVYVSGHQLEVSALHDHLVRLVEPLGSGHLQLLCDAIGTSALVTRGDLDSAVSQALDVRRRADAADVPMARYLAAAAPMAYALHTRQPELGIAWAEQCLADHFRFGVGSGGTFIETRGSLAAQQGHFRLAARLYAAAFAITRRVGMRWPWRDLTGELLVSIRAELGDTAFEAAWQSGLGLSPPAVLHGLRHGWDD